MGVNIQTLDLNKYKEKLLKNSEELVRETTGQVFIDVKRFSPIDSGRYVSGHKYLGVTRKGNQVIGIVENMGLYSERVETGFRTSPVNWKIRNLGQVYYSKGANVYQRAIGKNKLYFLNKLRGS